jgi:hypothetical protein
LSRSGEDLDRAVEGFDGLSAVFEGARAREAVAAVDPDRADALVGQARETYRRLGATVDLDRIGT